MALTIKPRGGALAGQTFSFPDEKETIILGRDPARCDVVFPPELRRVGREHCALRRELGRYKLQLNHDDPVWVEGRPAYDDQTLPPEAELQLGRGGPRLTVLTEGNEELPSTLHQGGHQAGSATMARQAAARSRRTGAIVLCTSLLVLLAAGLVLRQVLGRQDALGEAMERAKASVHMVIGILQDRNGGEEEVSLGTAWAVDKNLFATNAHVAGFWHKPIRGRGRCADFLLRPCDPALPDLRVDRVTLHPGYAEFRRLWQEAGRKAPLEACDVALLRTGSESRASPLPLATEEEIARIKPDQEIGIVGYPVLTSLTTAAKQRGQYTRRGRVTSICDFFRNSRSGVRAAAEGFLICHDAANLGGDSGSPVFDGRGKVIGIHAGGARQGGVRTGFNHAMRIDLLRELLGKGPKPEIREARKKGWEKGIKELIGNGPEPEIREAREKR